MVLPRHQKRAIQEWLHGGRLSNGISRQKCEVTSWRSASSRTTLSPHSNNGFLRRFLCKVTLDLLLSALYTRGGQAQKQRMRDYGFYNILTQGQQFEQLSESESACNKHYCNAVCTVCKAQDPLEPTLSTVLKPCCSNS